MSEASPDHHGEPVDASQHAASDVTPDAALARGAEPSALRHAVMLLLITVGAYAVCLFFHAPNVHYWAYLHDPMLSHRPELNRALSTEQQLVDPWAPIDNPSNRVIRWRLLFPLIGHYTHMPLAMYLMLPHLGALLVLGLAAHVVWQRTGSYALAALGAAWCGSLSWFAVGTGWLAYFDPWYVLGLMIVAFFPSRVALVVAALAGSWVDDRFVLGLPAALAVRAATLGRIDTSRWRAMLGDVACVAAGVAPYVAIRLIETLTSERGGETGRYLRLLLADQQLVTRHMLVGAAYGLGLAWLAVGAFLARHTRRDRLAWAVLVWLAVGASLAVSVMLAGDYSRSASVVTPVVIAGVIAASTVPWFAGAPRRLAAVLGVVLLAQLLWPSRHVVGAHRVDIVMLPTAIDLYRHPENDPVIWSSIGDAALRSGDFDKASAAFDKALSLDPDNLAARANRATVYAVQGDLVTALNIFNAVLADAPRDWHLADKVRGARDAVEAQLRLRQHQSQLQ